jgi:hypothetical protein
MSNVSSSLGRPTISLPPAERGASPTQRLAEYRSPLLLALALALTLTACPRRKEEITFSDAAAPIVSTPVVVAPPVDAGPSPTARELERANGWLADLKFLLANKVTTSPKLISGEGDATAICDAANAARPKTTDPETARTLDEALPLCAFDVPLLVANEALDHLKTSTSQASVRLMCSVSAKEIAKARAVKPKDPKVLHAERRRSASGRCH